MTLENEQLAVMLGPVPYEHWALIHAWLTENRIRWYAMGNYTIGFDNKQDAVLFSLRWS
jgi:hypothetical protein